MLELFDVDTAFVTLAGYPMSFVELAGSVLNLWSVWLVARHSVWTWPVGNAAVLLFAILFYQIRLYSDFLEQLYFLAAGFYGWWMWLRPIGGARAAAGPREIRHATARGRVAATAVVAAGTLALGHAMTRAHVALPALFPEPASFPYLDAFTTVMSFTATALMAHKKVDCWPLWIAVDVIGIGLYAAKDVLLVAGLYLCFLVLATYGWRRWLELARTPEARA